MMKEKISVIIPTYKRPQLLSKCLAALSAQSIGKEYFEVLVVSDGKDEATEKLIFKYRLLKNLNIRFFQNPVQKGPATARNLGWLNARSALIAFTDDDCIPAKDWLKNLLKNYHGETLLAFSGKTKVPLTTNRTDFALNTAQLEKANFITANCACTKQALIKIGGFDERFKMAWREDSDLEFKLITQGIEIIKVDALVVHPVRPAAWGVSIREQRKGIYDALLFKKYPQLFLKKLHIKILNYYLILILIIAASLSTGTRQLTLICLLLTAALFFQLIYKRIRYAEKSGKHIAEMIATSLVIPFLAVYWRLYGAIKFKVLYL